MNYPLTWMHSQILDIRTLTFLINSILLTTDDMNFAELKDGKEYSQHMLFHKQHMWQPRER